MGTPPNVQELITGPADKNLLRCDLFIFELLNSREAKLLLNAIHAAKFTEDKMIITVSNVMTWAGTTAAADGKDDGFFEEDYAKRKPHAMFKDVNALEALARRAQKDNLKVFNICSGFLYGAQGGSFYPFLRAAWECRQSGLICYGDGDNIVPCIHVQDLVSTILSVKSSPPETQYILAVDAGTSTMHSILNAVATYGMGGVKMAPVEQLAIETNSELACLFQANLLMTSGFLKNAEMTWKAESGLVANMASVYEEFRAAHGLEALKMVIIGPPSSGKTYWAAQLAKEYLIHHVQLEKIIEKHTGNPQSSFAEEVATAASRRERLSDDVINQMVREHLLSRPCVNQGYILDGFPKDADSARRIFGNGSDLDEDDDRSKLVLDPRLMCKLVIQLEAPDSFLQNRVMNLPQSAVDNTHNDELGFTRRLAAYRLQTASDETLARFFEREAKIDPLAVDVTEDDEEELMSSLKAYLGFPKNFGPSQEEVESKRLAKEMEERARQEKIFADISERERLEREDRENRVAAEHARLEKLELQERELLEVRAKPLRRYLMDHVLPGLTEALLEVCRVRPEDPVDYLAEFLFRYNPDSVPQISAEASS